MRILTVTNMYPSSAFPIRGIFVHEHVKALRDLGLEVEVFAPDAGNGRIDYLTQIPKLRRVIREGSFNLIHAHHTYSVHQVTLSAAGMRTKPPIVFTTHEGEVFLPPGLWRHQRDLLKRLVYWKAPKRLALNLADRVVSVESRLPRMAGYRGPYEVITPGVDLDRFCPMERVSCRQQLGLTLEASVILAPASPRRRFEKGLDLVEQSVKNLGRPVELVVGGSIPPDQMPVYLNAADVIVQASRYEASPMVIKEAMACNRPVVTTRVGDVEEIFGGLPGHFLTSHCPEDIAEKLSRGLDIRETQGRDRITQLGLSVADVANRYVRVYQELCTARA